MMTYIGLLMYLALITLFYSSRKITEEPLAIRAYSRIIGYSWVIILSYIVRILFSSYISESGIVNISFISAVLATVIFIEMLRVYHKT